MNPLVKTAKNLGIYKTLKGIKKAYNRRLPKQRVRHEKTVSFFSQFIRKNNLCFDIGANVGDITLALNALGSKVVAIEPVNSAFFKLKKNFFNLKNIKTINFAIGNKESESTITVCEDDTLSSMSKEYIKKMVSIKELSNLEWNQRQKVKVTTIDKLIQKYGIPNYIKIDVEGYEWEVLRGLSTPINLISFEFNTYLLNAFENCTKLLSKLGHYEYNYEIREKKNLILPRWVEKKQIEKIILSVDKGILFGNIYARLKDHRRSLLSDKKSIEK